MSAVWGEMIRVAVEVPSFLRKVSEYVVRGTETGVGSGSGRGFATEPGLGPSHPEHDHRGDLIENIAKAYLRVWQACVGSDPIAHRRRPGTSAAIQSTTSTPKYVWKEISGLWKQWEGENKTGCAWLVTLLYTYVQMKPEQTISTSLLPSSSSSSSSSSSFSFTLEDDDIASSPPVSPSMHCESRVVGCWDSIWIKHLLPITHTLISTPTGPTSGQHPLLSLSINTPGEVGMRLHCLATLAAVCRVWNNADKNVITHVSISSQRRTLSCHFDFSSILSRNMTLSA